MLKKTLSLVLLLAFAASAAAQTRTFDPVRSDPPADAKYPASMDELGVMSHGSRMNGFIYVASGAERHPIVVLLHGFPGNERNLDLAQMMRRAGYDVLYFDYRGSWGSGGTFSFANAREDVASALAWLRTPANAAEYRIDPRRVALVGHSMGGWLAYQGAARDPKVACVVALAPWNIGAGAQMMKDDPAARQSTSAYNDLVTGPGGPLHARGADLTREMEMNAKAYDYLRLAPALHDRALLLVGATNDSPDENPSMNAKMEKALRNAGATRIQNVTFEDDHPFSAHRIALGELVVRWLEGDCSAVWSKS